jgi:PBP1b-binding outer membrane lipoprotein LpoB
MKLITGLAVTALLLVGCGDKNAEMDVAAEMDMAAAQPAAPVSTFVE